MRLTDREARPECSIIPFHRPEDQPENLTTTSIAAVIAVTILHSDKVSPEEKLLEIIEASGEAEVLDADDAAAVRCTHPRKATTCVAVACEA